EMLLVAGRVHGVPETVVAKRHQLAGLCEALERTMLERALVVKVLEYAGIEDEKAAVDPALARLRLLGELLHAGALEGERAETRGRMHGGQRRHAAVRVVKLHQRIEVNRREAVAVGRHERLFAQIGAEPQNAGAGLGLDAGVDRADSPVEVGSLDDLDRP